MTTLTADRLTIRNTWDILSGISLNLSPNRLWVFKTDDKIDESSSIKNQVDNILSLLAYMDCDVKNFDKVSSFLEKHAGILNYLLETPDVVKKYFNNCKMNLDLVVDPEVQDDDGELVLSIETSMEVEEARNILEKIDKKWFFKILDEDMYHFSLDLMFV